jgi:erythromycin esterase
VNTGQLAREMYGSDNVYLAGFASYEGSVIAGEQWGAPMEEMEVPAARAGSIEAELHRNFGDDGYILFSEEDNKLYETSVHHRAIGVVYDPAREKYGNYVPSVLSRRYDALIYIDATTALHPLVLHPDPHKFPETYPFKV